MRGSANLRGALNTAAAVVLAAAMVAKLSPIHAQTVESSSAKPLPGGITNPRRAATAPLGLRIVELEPAAARELSLDGGVRAVHVTGAAYLSGLRGDDIITALNGKPVSTVDAFWQMLEAANWNAALSVLREGKPIQLKLSPAPVNP
jgi:S1-C subfamily serine protease